MIRERGDQSSESVVSLASIPGLSLGQEKKKVVTYDSLVTINRMKNDQGVKDMTATHEVKGYGGVS